LPSRGVAELVASEVFQLYKVLDQEHIEALLRQVHRSAEAVMQLKEALGISLNRLVYE
jgi:hypothetical protein